MKIYFCDAVFPDDYKEARRKLPLAVDHTDIDQTDGGDSPITFQRKRM